MGRRKEQLVFAPDQPTAVVAWMEQLSAAGDGWLNLTPQVSEDEDAAFPRSGTSFAASFGRPPSTVLCTWVPPRRSRRRRETTVGILHPRGRAAAAHLRQAGRPVPAGWRVVQDNTRRGLVLRVPATVAAEDLLGWVLPACELLSVAPLTGRWRAEVFPPAGAEAASNADGTAGAAGTDGTAGAAGTDGTAGG